MLASEEGTKNKTVDVVYEETQEKRYSTCMACGRQKNFKTKPNISKDAEAVLLRWMISDENFEVPYPTIQVTSIIAYARFDLCVSSLCRNSCY
jgi:hypothetical protein